jgi:hypothetical protein
MSDLLDRCVLLNLPRIDEAKRIPEATLDRQFGEALPSILGGLLTAVSTALRNQSTVNLATLPRMADFAVWATAAESALGLTQGKFIEAYSANRAAGNETAIEASPVGRVLIEFVAIVHKWAGTSTELMEELESRADQKTKSLKSWPKTARTLGSVVKRLAPNLREVGIGVEFDRKGRKGSRIITLTAAVEHSGNPSSAPSAPSAGTESPEASDFSADANADNADANSLLSSSASSPVFFGENGHADATDNADAKIPSSSKRGEWCEV